MGTWRSDSGAGYTEREDYVDERSAEDRDGSRGTRVERERYVERRSMRGGDDEATFDASVVDHQRSSTAYLASIPARVNAVLFAGFAALEAVLLLRFVLVAFGASRSSGFVDFVHNVSWPFVRPFSNAFRDRTWDQGIIEPTTLLAMGVYFLIFALIALLVNTLLPRVEKTDAAVVRRRRVTHG